MEIRKVRYDHPDATLLTEQVQQEYVRRYGGPDETPMDAVDFNPPRGVFLVGYLLGEAVAIGGWRAQEATPEGFADGDAELKRMYVVPAARGRGLARRVLAELEASAAAAGRLRMVLETGVKQPEAIALYTSCGYRPISKFGLYRCEPESRYFGRSLIEEVGTQGHLPVHTTGR